MAFGLRAHDSSLYSLIAKTRSGLQIEFVTNTNRRRRRDQQMGSMLYMWRNVSVKNEWTDLMSEGMREEFGKKNWIFLNFDANNSIPSAENLQTYLQQVVFYLQSVDTTCIRIYVYCVWVETVFRCGVSLYNWPLFSLCPLTTHSQALSLFWPAKSAAFSVSTGFLDLVL